MSRSIRDGGGIWRERRGSRGCIQRSEGGREGKGRRGRMREGAGGAERGEGGGRREMAGAEWPLLWEGREIVVETSSAMKRWRAT
jgi:hypothetical protein